jgi:hypothetical protein
VTLRSGESRPGRQLASYRGFACAVSGVSSRFRTRSRKSGAKPSFSPPAAIFLASSGYTGQPRSQISGFRPLSQAGSRHFGSPPGCIATKRFRSGSPGLQASELRRVEAARASLKLSADNNLERYGTPRFHVEHFRGTHGTFCGTTRTSLEVNPVALNPAADGSVLPFKRTGPL